MTTEQNLNLKLERRARLAKQWSRMAGTTGDSDLVSYWKGYLDALSWAKNTIQPERIRLEALEQLRRAKKE